MSPASYLPFNEPLVHEPVRRNGGKVQALAALLIGFGLGCAAIYVGGGQPLAVLHPTMNMALQYAQPAQASRFMPYMQPAMPRYPVQPARFQPLVEPVSALKSQVEPSTISETQGRREMIAGLASAFGAAVAHDKAAFAVSPVDLKDDRKAKSIGFDIIYEARDLGLPQNIRDGLTQARESTENTKARIAESKQRISTGVLDAIKKSYWVEAAQALRLQLGTLRFDLNSLELKAPASEQKAVKAAKKKAFTDIEALDYAIRQKKLDASLKAYEKALSSLDAVLASVA